jgi:hypothetical protein
MAVSPVATSPPDQSSTPLPASAPSSGSTGGGILTYPIDMKDTQDRIKFTVWEVAKSDVKSTQLTDPGFNSKTGSGFGPVFLPIQPSITDNNTADWGEGRLNELQKRLVNSSLKAMNANNLGDVPSAFKDLFTSLANDPNLKSAGQLYFAEQAVGVQNLLSRATGNVFNPNLELLFQGPTLRPFQFQFKLSPRSQKEADRVKQIIKFFKQNMAVRKVNGNLFLKAPYVFGIEYQNGANKLHQSINKIKKCALQSCSVDYTPLGSYMTYEDSDATMVSYTISMQLQEIIPIYDTDYDDHPIGY